MKRMERFVLSLVLAGLTGGFRLGGDPRVQWLRADCFPAPPPSRRRSGRHWEEPALELPTPAGPPGSRRGIGTRAGPRSAESPARAGRREPR